MALYRDNRRLLAEAMETVRDVFFIEDILENEDQLTNKQQTKVTVKKYGEPGTIDRRIGWDTYIVNCEGYGVLGFTNGPLQRKKKV